MAEHHAGVVVQFAEGATRTYCIPFTGDSISGLDLLLKTGLEVKVEQYGSMGGQICKIGENGCDYPPDPCACQSYGPGGVYWSYTHLVGGAWKASPTGASSSRVHDGDVDGWAWTSGKGPNLTPNMGQLCPAAEPATQPPRPTNTLRPQNTLLLTITPLPSAIPTGAAAATMEVSNTPAPIATSQPTPTMAATQAAANPQSLAQILALAIGGAVIGGLALWRFFGARGRARL